MDRNIEAGSLPANWTSHEAVLRQKDERWKSPALRPPEFLWIQAVMHEEYDRLPPLLRAELEPAFYNQA